MLSAVLIATSFSLGFFVESIVGFGGGLIAYSLLGFFIDLKEMVLAGLYIGSCSSAFIFYSGRQNFDKEIFLKVAPLCLVGTILGVFIFSKFSSEILSFILGILLISLAIKTAFFDKKDFPKSFKNNLFFVGGISQGAFGIGGPFFVNALKKDFKNKSALRTTMAAIFLFFNLVRTLQLGIHGDLDPKFFFYISWTIIPVFFAIKMGYKIHLKISEDFFKKLIGLITIFAGVKFLV